MKYPIGTKFIRRSNRKHKLVETVTDYLETRSVVTGDLISSRYVATHEFCGQTVSDRDIPATSIAMGQIINA